MPPRQWLPELGCDHADREVPVDMLPVQRFEFGHAGWREHHLAEQGLLAIHFHFAGLRARGLLVDVELLGLLGLLGLHWPLLGHCLKRLPFGLQTRLQPRHHHIFLKLRVSEDDTPEELLRGGWVMLV